MAIRSLTIEDFVVSVLTYDMNGEPYRDLFGWHSISCLCTKCMACDSAAILSTPRLRL